MILLLVYLMFHFIFYYFNLFLVLLSERIYVSFNYYYYIYTNFLFSFFCLMNWIQIFAFLFSIIYFIIYLCC